MKYQMNRTLIVSNKISSYQNQLKNTVPIVPFDGNEKDRELEGLEKYLCSLARCNDLV
jgi:TFIIF-interacting CTD phosphatase-like protein